MGDVIHVKFGTEREWQQTHLKITEGLVTIGGLFGDSEPLMRAKADYTLQILRQMVEDVPNVRTTVKILPGLSEQQLEMVSAAAKEASSAAIEVTLNHCVQLLMKSIYDLCTSKLAPTSE